MKNYQLTWITSSLAVGCAPMSFVELGSIKKHGVDAILNLCGEFCDLHEIEEKTGFEVYFLPIPDENAPDMEEMEKALDWLDEALYLGKKVLVHCRHGIGRTGTIVSAYLIRRGMGLKLASKKMRKTRANPTNYAQWSFLKKYNKKVGQLSSVESVMPNHGVVDLTIYFTEYEALVREVEDQFAIAEKNSGKIPRCGRDTDSCCHSTFNLKLSEAMFLLNKMNKHLSSKERKKTIKRSVTTSPKNRGLARNNHESDKDGRPFAMSPDEDFTCPLNISARCLLYEFRPIRCRCYGGFNEHDFGMVEDSLSKLSRNLFFKISGTHQGIEKLRFSCSDTVSGNFVQIYFHYLASLSLL